jgi:regulator of sigma E protease
LTILAFLFVLGVLIFVHELGHFLMARRIGVRVLTFSLGFGPKLVNIKRGDTEYCISAIPLGGYVKMAGENPEDSRTGAPDEFLSQGKWQRFQVLVMGPIMNLALALVVMALVFYQGAQEPAFQRQPVEIGSFQSNSVAQAAGLKPGDRIISVDGKPVENWDQFSMLIVGKAKRQVAVGYVRDGRAAEALMVPLAQGKYEMGDVGVLPRIRPEIDEVFPGQPAAQAGLRQRDVILAVGDRENIQYDPLIDLLRTSPDTPLKFTIKRDGAIQTLTITPHYLGTTAKVNGVDKPVATIGARILPWETITVNPGPVEAVKLSAQKNWEWASLIVQTLKGLFTRETSVKQLMGPVAIADLSGAAAEAGWISLFTLMAMISLNLGLLNLMPIPVLDGGHIFILALEGLARRDFSMKVKEKMLIAGFVLLVMLMVTVIYNDLMRIQWIEKLVPWR